MPGGVRAAGQALGLDEIWWLVSPGNPLKPREGMAPLSARLASARAMGRRSIIRVSDLERRLGVPQDIEFAFEDGRLYVLQARPVTVR